MLNETAEKGTAVNERAVNETAENETAVNETAMNETAMNETDAKGTAANETAVNETAEKIKAVEFIRWALKHAKRESIPKGADIPLPAEECGIEPWHYLFGTVKAHTTPAKIEERWMNFYSRKGWPREKYDKATKDMLPTDYATDCAGLLDAFLSEKAGKTDKNSHAYYEECTDRGRIGSIGRAYIPGEPVFMAGRSGRMHHIGFVCGFLDGEPLIVEARGLSYGVVVTKFSEREWTHHGLLTGYFTYDESGTEPDGKKETTVFEYCRPMMRGENVKALQSMLNEAGYTDEEGSVLEEDGRFGKRSFAALKKFITAHTALAENIPADTVPAGEIPEEASGEEIPGGLPDEISVKQEINGIAYEGMLERKNIE